MSAEGWALVVCSVVVTFLSELRAALEDEAGRRAHRELNVRQAARGAPASQRRCSVTPERSDPAVGGAGAPHRRVSGRGRTFPESIYLPADGGQRETRTAGRLILTSRQRSGADLTGL